MKVLMYVVHVFDVRSPVQEPNILEFIFDSLEKTRMNAPMINQYILER